jgi:hypothetical protein
VLHYLKRARNRVTEGEEEEEEEEEENGLGSNLLREFLTSHYYEPSTTESLTAASYGSYD